jgi:hypothetical protein
MTKITARSVGGQERCSGLTEGGFTGIEQAGTRSQISRRNAHLWNFKRNSFRRTHRVDPTPPKCGGEAPSIHTARVLAAPISRTLTHMRDLREELRYKLAQCPISPSS